MGTWDDLKIKTKYDSLSFEDREKVRQQYFEDMESDYSPEEIGGFLEKFRAYDKEREVDSPIAAKSRNEQKKSRLEYVKSVSGGDKYLETMLGANATAGLELPDELKSPERLAKERIALKSYNTDEELDVAVAEEQKNPSAFKTGVRESYLATRGIDNLAPDQKRAVIGAIEQSRQNYEDQLAKEGKGKKILDRAVEMTGSMAGSPSTYIFPAVGGLGIKGAALIGEKAAKGAALFLPGAYGVASGIEQGMSQQNMGRDVDLVEEGAVGFAGGMSGGVAGSRLSKVAQKMIKPGMAQNIISGVFGMTGYGIGQTAVSTADALRRDPSQDVGKLVKEQGVNLLASSLTGIPGMLPSIHAQKIAPSVARKYGKPVSEVRAALESYANIREAELNAARELGDKVDIQPKLFKDKKDIEFIEEKFAEHERETRGDMPFKDQVKRGAKKGSGIMGQLFADKEFSALSELYSQARKEKTVMIDRIIELQKKRTEKNGRVFDEAKARAAIEDRMTKGKVRGPISERVARLIESEPTLLTNANHNANQVITNITKGLSTTESVMLNRYLVAKNQQSQKERKNHRPPKGLSKEDVDRIVDTVEGDLENKKIIEKAQEVWALAKMTVMREYEMGKISKGQRDALLKTPYYVPTKMNEPFHHFRVLDDPERTAGEGDPFEHLTTGANVTINTDVMKLVHQRLVQSEMSQHKHERLLLLAKMADEGAPGMRLANTDDVLIGEAAIPYRVKGETKYIIVPDWFKKSLEVHGVDPSTKLMSFLSVMFGTAPLKKFTVQWNPEFALANMPRDYARTFRMMAITADKNAPLGKMLWENNPVKYSIEMNKTLKDVLLDFKGWKEYARENGALRGRITMEYDGDMYASKIGKGKRKIDELMGFTNAFSEDLMRVAGFKMLIDKGFTPKEAGERVGKFLDYNRRGVLSGVVDSLCPFFNVMIQAPRADIRIAKANPKAYAIRTGYNIATAAAISAGLYAVFKDEVDKQSTSRDKEAALIIPISQNEDKSWNVFKWYLDQQDRLSWALGDSIARMAAGRKVDIERLGLAVRDFVSIPTSPKQLIPPMMKALYILDGYNKNDWTGQPYAFTPTPMDENADLAIDPKRDHPVSVAVSQILATLGIHKQPALISAAFHTLCPTNFLETFGMFVVNATQGDIDARKLPMVRKVVRQTDEELPLRTEMHKGEVEKNKELLKRWAEKRRMQMLNDNDYQINMLDKINAETNPFERKRMIKEYKETLKERRRSGEDTSIKKYLLYKVAPSQYEAVEEKYRELKGRSLEDDPRILRAMMRQRAQEQYDDSGEQ